MLNSLISIKNPLIIINPIAKPSLSPLKPIYYCSNKQQNRKNTINKPGRPKTPIIIPYQDKVKRVYEERGGFSQVGIQQMLVFCGFGYWVAGFRCFPWLGLNFHMAYNLNLHPSTLQLVQNAANLPMVVKPLYGIFSESVYIRCAHRIPYISIGAILQVLSWGSLALIPGAGEALPTFMACVLLTNLGASITEVSKDGLVAEYGQKNKMIGLQSYAFMALAAGGILGNLTGGFFLLKTRQPKSMFLVFAGLLALQLGTSLATREDSLGLYQPVARKSILGSIRKQCSDLMVAISEESICRPLIWIVASIAVVPILSGSTFCYQTQYLKLDPLIIGMSKVIGQLMLLSMTVLYVRLWKNVPMMKLIGIVQILYSFSLLLDLLLVNQVNLRLGIPNETFVLCFSAVAEIIAQFKLLPFQMLFASLAPRGCEGSLISFLASAFCLSSIFSGFLGIGLASLLGIKSGDYSTLPVGIVIQFLAALLPLQWIHHIPISQPDDGKERKIGRSRRTRRNRRIGRVMMSLVYAYCRERESEVDR